MDYDSETNSYGNLTGDYDPLTGTTSASYNSGRYNDDMLNDLATRADWCVASKYEDANHRPEVTVAETAITAAPGEEVTLSCTWSDPDGDDVRLNWFQYKEAGTYANQFLLPDPSDETITFCVPQDALDGDVIVIQLEGKDNGEHPLVDYAQTIITVSAPAEATDAAN